MILEMEDDKGIELSLGLSCGASSAKPKGKIGSSSDTKIEEGDRGIKIMDNFKNFLQAGTQKQDLNVGSQRNDPVKPSEIFFNDLSKAANGTEAFVNLNGKGLWGTNNNSSAKIYEDKWSETGGKRTMLFDEINNPKKLEREAYHTNLHDRAAYISITTEDDSTAENEDVAGSEVEGSIHTMIMGIRFIGVSGSSEVPNEVKLGNLNYGNPFPMQSVNVMNVPFSLPMKDSNYDATSSSSGHTLPCIIQIMPSGNSERSGTQPVPGNLPVMFGYSTVQLALLDTDNVERSGTQPVPENLPVILVAQLSNFHCWEKIIPGSSLALHGFTHSYAGRGPTNLDKQCDGLKTSQAYVHTITCNSSEAAKYDGGIVERVKGEGKLHATEECSSSEADEDVNRSGLNNKANAASDRPTTEGLSLDFSAKKPGIAANLKIGGSGFHPNLPWDSTTGTGLHGRTISAVTYRFSANQIKIVCAYHGTHMSPEDFVRHASEECKNLDTNNGSATFSSTNPVASAQS